MNSTAALRGSDGKCAAGRIGGRNTASDIFIGVGFVAIGIDFMGIAVDVGRVGTLPHTPPIPCAKRTRQSSRWPRRRSMTRPDCLFSRYFQGKQLPAPRVRAFARGLHLPLTTAWIGRFVRKRTDCTAWRTAT